MKGAPGAVVGDGRYPRQEGHQVVQLDVLEGLHLQPLLQVRPQAHEQGLWEEEEEETWRK